MAAQLSGQLRQEDHMLNTVGLWEEFKGSWATALLHMHKAQSVPCAVKTKQ